ncbi:hypothetical protein AB0L65_20275 [Nonomuraea sp. NPDC052116]|uniref:hypothetical protein n=1 Tax=Nonomuraea sp. NPDC052116 TaxID=3155665 RepID=UPI003435D48D
MREGQAADSGSAMLFAGVGATSAPLARGRSSPSQPTRGLAQISSPGEVQHDVLEHEDVEVAHHDPGEGGGRDVEHRLISGNLVAVTLEGCRRG